MVDLSEVRKISMLAEPVLQRLQALARFGYGGILEIGPYIGGSSIALASGHNGRRKHAAIDCGGEYLAHPMLPSADIHYDWTLNLVRFGYGGQVKLIGGFSNTPAFWPALKHIDYDINMFFFDGDGRCDQQFAIFHRYMRPSCAIVLDDYIVHGDQTKANLVKTFVDRAVQAGGLIADTIIDGTWFGWLGEPCPELLSCYFHSSGHAWWTHAPWPVAGAPPLRVYEDGKLLEPGSSDYVTVAEIGRGAHRHALAPRDALVSYPHVLFSTSDNSDPNTNGRTYRFA